MEWKKWQQFFQTAIALSSFPITKRDANGEARPSIQRMHRASYEQKFPRAGFVETVQARLKSAPNTASRNIARTPSYPCAAPNISAENTTPTTAAPRAHAVNCCCKYPRNTSSSATPTSTHSNSQHAISLPFVGANCTTARAAFSCDESGAIVFPVWPVLNRYRLVRDGRLDADPHKHERCQHHQRTHPEQNRNARIECNRAKIAGYLPKERSQRNPSQPQPKGDPAHQHQLKPRSLAIGVKPIRRTTPASAGMPVNASQIETREYPNDQQDRVPHRSNRCRRLGAAGSPIGAAKPMRFRASLFDLAR